MKIPKISVVIPSYNKVNYISQTLDSIIAQKYQNLEVIIQDGGSTDGTLQIIKKYVNRYSKVFRYESKKDKGQLDAINKGIGKTTGEILTFINADDIYLPEAFSEVAKQYLANPGAFWFAGRGKVVNTLGCEIAKAVTCYKNVFLFLNLHFGLLIFNYLMQPSVFLTRLAWQKYGPFTGTSNFVTEYDFWLKISKRQMPVLSDKYFSSFRIEPSTITKTNSVKLLLEDERVVQRYTSNPVLLTLHKLNNLGRILIGNSL